MRRGMPLIGLDGLGLLGLTEATSKDGRLPSGATVGAWPERTAADRTTANAPPGPGIFMIWVPLLQTREAPSRFPAPPEQTALRAGLGAGRMVQVRRVGREAALRVAAVAERFGGRRAAPAQRHRTAARGVLHAVPID